MKGDFSRDTFDATKHFSRVLMQQGRVQLDADWNEQTSILLHYLRTLAKDILGPAAAVGDGFKIKVEDNKIKIGAGRMYVDGILCENDTDTNFIEQKNYPNPTMPTKDGSYLVYLDVWERHITALEDDSIREKALGGADTATRTEVVWQVKISDLLTDNISGCEDAFNNVFKKSEIKRTLVVSFNKETIQTSCSISPESKYRGLENHLYRVEIHQGGTTETATFKWSRENGSVVTGCTIQGSTIKVDNPNGFCVGDWVELISNAQELREEPGVLVQVDAIDNDLLIFKEISPPDGLPDNEKGSWPDKVRRWESDAISVVSVVANESMIKLEHGIQIQFSGSSYTTGDYWLIPARVADGAIEWANNGDRVEPHGVTHHYAPLAILTHTNGNWTTGVKTDCRNIIKK